MSGQLVEELLTAMQRIAELEATLKISEGQTEALNEGTILMQQRIAELEAEVERLRKALPETTITTMNKSGTAEGDSDAMGIAMGIVKQIALALATYETDEPHVSEWSDEKPHFPEYSWDQLEQWTGQPHDGDCIKQPQPCMRCWAEHIIDKAEFIAGRLEQEGDSDG